MRTKFDRLFVYGSVDYADWARDDHLLKLSQNKGFRILNTWLPLTDYSTKYKVSVSTLRRRIKAEDIRFRFEDGKYFISDEPVGTHQRAHRPSQVSDNALMGTHSQMPTAAPLVTEKAQSVTTVAANQSSTMIPPASRVEFRSETRNETKDEPILTAANKLLNELKKAYSLILQEKEEQILQLKSELADLKTLVRVLESENDRLKNYKQ